MFVLKLAHRYSYILFLINIQINNPYITHRLGAGIEHTIHGAEKGLQYTAPSGKILIKEQINSFFFFWNCYLFHYLRPIFSEVYSLSNTGKSYWMRR